MTLLIVILLVALSASLVLFGLKSTIITLAILGAVITPLIMWGRALQARQRREMANGTYANRFVKVEDDGTVLELAPDEIDYLTLSSTAQTEIAPTSSPVTRL